MLNNRIILLWIVAIFLFYSLSATSVFAKSGGKGHGGGSPHGWSQGKKKGWNSDAPPGVEKKGEDWKPSGLNDEKDLQKENEKVEKQQEKAQEETEKKQEKEQKKKRERKRHREREQKGGSKEK